jgi:hypothetical protein
MEYQGTKEELNALMTGEVIGTAARAAFDFYVIGPFLACCLVGLALLIFWCGWWTLAILGALIVLLVLLPAGPPDPNEIMDKFLYSLPSGYRETYYNFLYQQRGFSDILLNHASEVLKDPEGFRKEIAPVLQRIAREKHTSLSDSKPLVQPIRANEPAELFAKLLSRFLFS